MLEHVYWCPHCEDFHSDKINFCGYSGKPIKDMKALVVFVKRTGQSLICTSEGRFIRDLNKLA